MDGRGEVAYVVGTGVDVTAQRDAERARRESEERYRDLFEHASDLIQSVAADGRFEYVNRAWRDTLGYGLDDVEKLTIWDVVAPEALPHCEELFGRVMAGEDVGRVEVAFLSRDGRRIALEGSVNARFAGGGAVSTRGIFRDLTERRDAERALRESEQRYRGLVESASDLIYLTDPEGRFTYANEVAIRITGYPREQLIGMHFRDLVREDARAETERYYRLQFDERRPSTYLEFPAVTRDGGEVWLGQNVQLLMRDGWVTAVQAVARDITGKHELERMKDELISIAGHELRTPLTSLRGSLELLAAGHMGTLSAAGERMLSIAVRNTDRLIRLVSDMLDTERLASGRLLLDLHDFEIALLFCEAVENVQELAARAEVRIVGTDAQGRVTADPARIVQVLVNLLSNAVKFSPRGGTVELRVVPADGAVRIEVADEGRGVPPEMVEHIFGRFQQVEPDDFQLRGGSGLGLSIVKGIVEQHGGRVGVESRPGRGSVFWFTLRSPGYG